jgi:hypothetical protein
LYGEDRRRRSADQWSRDPAHANEGGVKWLAKLDRWRRGKQPVPPNRSDAIRQLVERAIDADCSTSRKKKR